MKNFVKILFIASAFLLPLSTFAQAFKTTSGHTEFKSSVPLHSFTGSSDHLVGKITLPDSTVDFYVDLKTLDTGNGLRDKDMYETLKTDTYPFGEFYGKLISPFDLNSDRAQKAVVQGKFKIHGVSKPVKIEGTLQKTDQGLKVQADWKLDMTEYNIKPPSILFYRVDDEVTINIKATLAPLKN